MDQRPQARSEGVLVEWVDDELVLYDRVSHTAHCLSADAAAVWELCDGQRSVAQIADERGVAVEQVARALDELDAAALLETAAVTNHGLSRREATKRLAKIGAVAISAPLIYSVAIPAAAAAASGTGPSGGGDLCVGKDCDDNNACTIDTCDPATGNCQNTRKICNDYNVCTTDRCDPATGDCIYTPIVCPPSTNPCMTSGCDPTEGCVDRPVADGTPCTTDSVGAGTCQTGVCTPAL